MVYKTQGTCSREIHFDVENNKLKNVSFVGGCNGNLKGIGLLVEGMDIDDVIKRVEGVSSRRKNSPARGLLCAGLFLLFSS